MNAIATKERRVRLIEASDDYMKGKIDLPEFERRERDNTPDYKSTISGLARAQSVSRKWWRRIAGERNDTR